MKYYYIFKKHSGDDPYILECQPRRTERVPEKTRHQRALVHYTQPLLTCLNFDSVQSRGKLIVDCKHVSIFYLLGLGLLSENSLCGFPTC